ncbi:MAG: hypothetical protein R3E95_04585 [Thiolinea sp.]
MSIRQIFAVGGVGEADIEAFGIAFGLPYPFGFVQPTRLASMTASCWFW